MKALARYSLFGIINKTIACQPPAQDHTRAELVQVAFTIRRLLGYN